MNIKEIIASAKSKSDAARKIAQEHPEISHKEIASLTGLSSAGAVWWALNPEKNTERLNRKKSERTLPDVVAEFFESNPSEKYSMRYKSRYRRMLAGKLGIESQITIATDAGYEVSIVCRKKV